MKDRITGEEIKRISIDECDNWHFNDELHHDSGRYFSIVGLTNGKQEHLLIKQEEIGILGLIFCEVDDRPYFLIQHKKEPGNYPLSQWAPTVQATRSNYERIHKGKKTAYLEYFADLSEADVIASEQGDRFYNKFNRNAVRSVSKMIESEEDHYIWQSLKELQVSLQTDLKMNTDLRSVIATADWTIFSSDAHQIFQSNESSREYATTFNKSYHSFGVDNLVRAKNLQASFQPYDHDQWRQIPLSNLNHYVITNKGILDTTGREVISYYDIKLPSREVVHWQQPLYCRSEREYCLLCFKVENGEAKFYLRLYPEIGCVGRVEFGPSMQTGESINKVSIDQYRRFSSTMDTILSISQTDEGGRFYRNLCNYEIAHVNQVDHAHFDDKNGVWLSAGELQALCKQKGMLTNELRTCVSLLVSMA